MANTINVTYKVNEDGSLEQISKGAEKAAKSTDKLGNSSEHYSKKQKGVAGATSNSTKAFSKMTTGITGGLVPAYAALAANVFALSAAFNFFKRAADVKILEEGQVSYAKNTGFALQTVTRGLREASGGMLGFREAAEAAAIGVAKGFSPKQLNDLAEGARKASAALGRNFEDSFDRLIRGASKAEPELLDELGITLKLADATKTYGDAIGKNAKDLSAFERSQAVLIETQRQLNKMYGDMEGASNPFVELSKTFEDLVKSGTNFLMPLFETLAKIINGSAIAAIAVFGALGVSILKSMMPVDSIKEGLTNFKMRSQQAMESAKNDQESYRAELEKTNAAVKASKAQTVGQAAKALGGPSKLVKKAAAGELTDPKQIGQLKANLKKAEAEYRRYGEVTKGVFQGASLSQIQSLKTALNTMNKDHVNFFQRTKMGYKQMSLYAKVQFTKIRAAGTKALAGLGTAFGKLSGAMNKAMKMAGFIGMFMMIVEIGQQLMQVPMDLVMGILKGVDYAVKLSLKGIGMVIDFAGNMLKGLINGLFMAINKGFELFGAEGPLKYLDSNSTAAADYMENLGDSVVNMASAFENSGLGKSLQGFQDRRVAAEQESQAYDKLKESIKSTGEELRNISKGLEEQSGAKRETSAATALSTLNLSGIMADINRKRKDKDGNFTDEFVLSEAKRANAIKLLKAQMKELGIVSPTALQAVNNMDIKALREVETAAQAATGGLAAMEDEIRGINSSISSGSLLEAEFALAALEGVANDTSAAFIAFAGEDSKAAKKALEDFNKAFSGPTMTSKQFLTALKELRVAQDDLAASTARASLVGGEYGKTFAFQLEVTKADLAIRQKKLEIEAADNEVTREKLRLELQLLEIQKRKAGTELQSNTQGSAMAAASATGALAEEGTQAQLSPMLGELSKLGPEGEMISNAINGAFALQDAFSNAFSVIGEKGFKSGEGIQAGLEVAATAMNAIGGVLKSASQAQIADIDKQIAAEKKRDGKSKESVAKIAALERKKEAAKKKAFERDKKIQMAQILIATASAVMQSFQNAGGFPLGMGTAMAMAAIGAAQLAIVSSSTYDGGGGSTGNIGAPSQVNVGNRQNSVDTAKARSPSGELAYARGASGIGSGMTNFTPAFTGAKYRAAGGNTAFMVGEQGPEMFIPERPGRIAPADDTEAMGQTPVNVSFNISAIDSTNMEDMLMTQRGNLIGMIREAANSHGETFLESVSTREI